jgi:hypothetical protein
VTAVFTRVEAAGTLDTTETLIDYRGDKFVPNEWRVFRDLERGRVYITIANFGARSIADLQCAWFTPDDPDLPGVVLDVLTALELCPPIIDPRARLSAVDG